MTNQGFLEISFFKGNFYFLFFVEKNGDNHIIGTLQPEAKASA